MKPVLLLTALFVALSACACDRTPKGQGIMPKTLRVHHSEKAPVAPDLAGTIETIDDEKFEKVRRLPEVLVEFYATWCDACKALVPLMEDFKKSHPNTPIYRINVDKSPQTTKAYDVIIVPTVRLFRLGTSDGSLVGADDITLDNLDRMLRSNYL